MTQLLDCGHPVSPHSKITTGYGIDENGKKHCYQCCASHDRELMDKHGKITLYLCLGHMASNWGPWYDAKVTNWPGSLEFKGRAKCGRHNIAGNRYDVWFTDHKGNKWHGVQYGDNTQICHCKKLKH